MVDPYPTILAPLPWEEQPEAAEPLQLGPTLERQKQDLRARKKSPVHPYFDYVEDINYPTQEEFIADTVNLPDLGINEMSQEEIDQATFELTKLHEATDLDKSNFDINGLESLILEGGFDEDKTRELATFWMLYSLPGMKPGDETDYGRVSELYFGNVTEPEKAMEIIKTHIPQPNVKSDFDNYVASSKIKQYEQGLKNVNVAEYFNPDDLNDREIIAVSNAMNKNLFKMFGTFSETIREDIKHIESLRAVLPIRGKPTIEQRKDFIREVIDNRNRLDFDPILKDGRVRASGRFNKRLITAERRRLLKKDRPKYIRNLRAIIPDKDEVFFRKMATTGEANLTEYANVSKLGKVYGWEFANAINPELDYGILRENITTGWRTLVDKGTNTVAFFQGALDRVNPMLTNERYIREIVRNIDVPLNEIFTEDGHYADPAYRDMVKNLLEKTWDGFKFDNLSEDYADQMPAIYQLFTEERKEQLFGKQVQTATTQQLKEREGVRRWIMGTTEIISRWAPEILLTKGLGAAGASVGTKALAAAGTLHADMAGQMYRTLLDAGGDPEVSFGMATSYGFLAAYLERMSFNRAFRSPIGSKVLKEMAEGQALKFYSKEIGLALLERYTAEELTEITQGKLEQSFLIASAVVADAEGIEVDEIRKEMGIKGTLKQTLERAGPLGLTTLITGGFATVRETTALKQGMQNIATANRILEEVTPSTVKKGVLQDYINAKDEDAKSNVLIKSGLKGPDLVKAKQDYAQAEKDYLDRVAVEKEIGAVIKDTAPKAIRTLRRSEQLPDYAPDPKKARELTDTGTIPYELVDPIPVSDDGLFTPEGDEIFRLDKEISFTLPEGDAKIEEIQQKFPQVNVTTKRGVSTVTIQPGLTYTIDRKQTSDLAVDYIVPVNEEVGIPFDDTLIDETAVGRETVGEDLRDEAEAGQTDAEVEPAVETRPLYEIVDEWDQRRDEVRQAVIQMGGIKANAKKNFGFPKRFWAKVKRKGLSLQNLVNQLQNQFDYLQGRSPEFIADMVKAETDFSTTELIGDELPTTTAAERLGVVDAQLSDTELAERRETEEIERLKNEEIRKTYDLERDINKLNDEIDNLDSDINTITNSVENLREKRENLNKQQPKTVKERQQIRRQKKSNRKRIKEKERQLNEKENRRKTILKEQDSINKQIDDIYRGIEQIDVPLLPEEKTVAEQLQPDLIETQLFEKTQVIEKQDEIKKIEAEALDAVLNLDNDITEEDLASLEEPLVEPEEEALFDEDITVEDVAMDDGDIDEIAESILGEQVGPADPKTAFQRVTDEFKRSVRNAILDRGGIKVSEEESRGVPPAYRTRRGEKGLAFEELISELEGDFPSLENRNPDFVVDLLKGPAEFEIAEQTEEFIEVQAADLAIGDAFRSVNNEREVVVGKDGEGNILTQDGEARTYEPDDPIGVAADIETASARELLDATKRYEQQEKVDPDVEAAVEGIYGEQAQGIASLPIEQRIELVREMFPTGEVEVVGGNAIVTLPDNSVVTVQLVDKIPGAEEKQGRFLSWRNIVQLAGEATEFTLGHETWHVAEKLALNPEDIQFLRRKVGNTEVTADTFAQFRVNEKAAVGVKRIFNKVKNFAADILDVFGVKTVRGQFKAVQTGEAYQRAEAKERVLPEQQFKDITDDIAVELAAKMYKGKKVTIADAEKLIKKLKLPLDAEGVLYEAELIHDTLQQAAESVRKRFKNISNPRMMKKIEEALLRGERLGYRRGRLEEAARKRLERVVELNRDAGKARREMKKEENKVHKELRDNFRKTKDYQKAVFQYMKDNAISEKR